MGSRKLTRDAIDKLWRRWLKKKGFGWIDYAKTKVVDITVTYAVEIHKANELMNEAYRAGFADGVREAKGATTAEMRQQISRWVNGMQPPHVVGANPCPCRQCIFYWFARRVAETVKGDA